MLPSAPSYTQAWKHSWAAQSSRQLLLSRLCLVYSKGFVLPLITARSHLYLEDAVMPTERSDRLLARGSSCFGDTHMTHRQPEGHAAMGSASSKLQVPYCIPHVCLPSRIKIASTAHHSHFSTSKTCGDSRLFVGKRDTALLIKASLFLTMANSCKCHSAA